MQTIISDIFSRMLLSPSLLHSFYIVLLNPFLPSIPKNGTPTLTVNREIIQALMGYATVTTYSALSRSLTTINLLHAGG